jgi:hypothetical protein
MKRSLILLTLFAGACRDVPERFAGPDPFDSISSSDAGRLTWNLKEDHSPAFSHDNNQIYYSARSYPGFPLTESLLLSVPRTVGRAKVILEEIQGAVSPQPRLAAPAISPNGNSIAFVELTQLHDPTELCNDRISCAVAPLPAPPPDTGAANALLMQGRLRIRPLNGSGNEVSIPIVFEGNQGDDRIAHPFQRQFERDRAEIFRPSWSPDGSRVVFSDGLRLWIWAVGGGAPTQILGTADGVWPAWSPNGDLIAFTKLQRGPVQTFGCECWRRGRPLPVANLRRVITNDGRRRVGTLQTIRPDGTGLATLGEGEAPAWTPDGQTLVFQRGGQLWRANRDGTNAVALPNTQFGYEPAISRDGRWLAFTRDMKQGDRANNLEMPYDLFVIGF